MAKIRKIEYRSQGKKVEAHIEHFSDKSLFFVRIADEFRALTESPEWKERIARIRVQGISHLAVYGKTDHEAEKVWHEFMDAYAAVSMKRKRVIVYKFGGHAGRGDGVGTMQDTWGRSEEDGAEIRFDFAVCEKRDFQGAITYHSEGGRKNDIRGRVRDLEDVDTAKSADGWMETPYTEEAEIFFQSLQKGMAELILKFDKFIGSKARLKKTIDSRQKLLA